MLIIPLYENKRFVHPMWKINTNKKVKKGVKFPVHQDS